MIILFCISQKESDSGNILKLPYSTVSSVSYTESAAVSL